MDEHPKLVHLPLNPCPTRVKQLFDTRQTAVRPPSNSCSTRVGQGLDGRWPELGAGTIGITRQLAGFSTAGRRSDVGSPLLPALHRVVNIL